MYSLDHRNRNVCGILGSTETSSEDSLAQSHSELCLMPLQEGAPILGSSSLLGGTGGSVRDPANIRIALLSRTLAH